MYPSLLTICNIRNCTTRTTRNTRNTRTIFTIFLSLLAQLILSSCNTASPDRLDFYRTPVPGQASFLFYVNHTLSGSISPPQGNNVPIPLPDDFNCETIATADLDIQPPDPRPDAISNVSNYLFVYEATQTTSFFDGIASPEEINKECDIRLLISLLIPFDIVFMNQGMPDEVRTREYEGLEDEYTITLSDDPNNDTLIGLAEVGEELLVSSSEWEGSITFTSSEPDSNDPEDPPLARDPQDETWTVTLDLTHIPTGRSISLSEETFIFAP